MGRGGQTQTVERMGLIEYSRESKAVNISSDSSEDKSRMTNAMVYYGRGPGGHGDGEGRSGYYGRRFGGHGGHESKDEGK